MADPWRTVTFFVFLESLLPWLGETFKSAGRGGRCGGGGVGVKGGGGLGFTPNNAKKKIIK